MFVNFGGSVWEHTGTNKNSGWFEVQSSGATSISALGIQADSVYVNLGGALWEHVGTDQNSGWHEIWESGASSISAGLN